MRVLFFGDLGPFGFGTVTMDLGRQLLDLGVDMRFVSQNDLADAPPEPFASRTVDLRTLTPMQSPITGMIEGIVPMETDVIAGLLTGNTPALLYGARPWGDWKPDAAVILADFTAARMMVARSPQSFAELPTWHYVPIEGIGLPPAWKDTWDLIEPVAMSQFGAEQIAKVTGRRPEVIYHGVDAEAFHPVSTRNPVVLHAKDSPDVRLTSKAQCQQLWAAWFGLPTGKTWILRTDRHMPRKRYNSMLRALVPVLAARPEVTLVLHCQAFDMGGHLVDTISKLPGATPLNIPTEQRSQQGFSLFNREHAQILLTDTRGLPRPALVSLYNAADLYVSTSAEGFGLTIAEAIACGVPAVGMDYSAVPEVIGPAGVCVPRAYLVENEYDHFWAGIDEPELARRVEFLVTHKARREALGRKGPAHVAAKFDWATEAARFRDLLHSAVIDRKAA